MTGRMKKRAECPLFSFSMFLVIVMKAEWSVWPPPFGLFCLVNAHCQQAQSERKMAGVARDDIGDAAATDAIMVHAITSSRLSTESLKKFGNFGAPIFIRAVVVFPNLTRFALILVKVLCITAWHAAVAGADRQAVDFVDIKVPSVHATSICSWFDPAKQMISATIADSDNVCAVFDNRFASGLVLHKKLLSSCAELLILL